MDPLALREHLSIGQLLREATRRWLKGHEVLHILRNYKAEGYSHNRDVVTKYRLDGVVWRRGSDGKRLLECHERLKVDGVEVLRCCYVQAEANRSFHRRVYSLLGASSADDPTVLVHYLQEPTAIDYHHHPQPSPLRPLPTQPPAPAPSTGQVVDWDQLDEELMALVASPPAGPPLPGSPSPVMMMAAAESLYGQNQHHTLAQYCKPVAAATIQDLSPEWDYVTGGAKVLITGHFPPTAPGARLTCMFDNVVVPADLVQAGVLRCFVPSHIAGIVPLSITLGDRAPVSNVVHFEYRDFRAMTTSAPDTKEGAPPAAAVAPPTPTTPTYDDTFKADVLKRLAALESTMRHAPSTSTPTTTTTTTTTPMETCEAQQARDGGGGSAEYQKLWEAFSLLVKLEGARGPGDSLDRRSRTTSGGEAPSSEREREEQAALLIQSTFRDYRTKKRNEAAKKIQKLYRQRYAKRSGAATMIQAAFRGYTQKMRLLRMMKKAAAPADLGRGRPESSQDADDDDDVSEEKGKEQNDEEEERDDDVYAEKKGKERADDS